MPIYDVKCDNCNYEEEQFLKINENPKNCPKCNNKMEKLCTCKTFKLIYNNKKDICGWSSENYDNSQYNRTDLDFNAPPGQLKG